MFLLRVDSKQLVQFRIAICVCMFLLRVDSKQLVQFRIAICVCMFLLRVDSKQLVQFRIAICVCMFLPILCYFLAMYFFVFCLILNCLFMANETKNTEMLRSRQS